MKKKKKKMKRKFATLAAIQEMKCSICKLGMNENDATFDHIFPRSKGGTSKLSNLALAHRKCNSRKGSKTDLPLDIEYSH